MRSLILFLTTIFISFSLLSSAIAANVAELYPYGLSTFQEYVDLRSKGNKPSSRDLRDYERSYNKFVSKASVFKTDHDDLMAKYGGPVDGLKTVEQCVDETKAKVGRSILFSREITEAHRCYWDEYKNYEKQQAQAERQVAQQKQAEENKKLAIEQQKQREERNIVAEIYGVALHTATRQQMKKAIIKAGGVFNAELSDATTDYFASDQILPGSDVMSCMYTTDGKLAILSYAAFEPEIAKQYALAITEKYGTPRQVGALPEWTAKHGVSLALGLYPESSAFDPYYMLVYVTPAYQAVEAEENARQKAAKKKTMKAF